MGQFQRTKDQCLIIREFKLFNDDKSSGYQLYNSVTGGTVKSFNACGGKVYKKIWKC